MNGFNWMDIDDYWNNSKENGLAELREFVWYYGGWYCGDGIVVVVLYWWYCSGGIVVMVLLILWENYWWSWISAIIM